MASSGFFSAAQVCNIVCGESGDEGDVDYVFPGSDDEFDADELQEEYDILDREQDQDGPGLDDSPPCSPLLHSPTSTSLREDPQSGPSSSVESTAHRGRGAGSGRGRGRARGHGRGQAMAGQPGREENEWTNEPSQVIVEPFTQPTGPTIQLGSDPLEVFTSLFTPALVEHMVLETNKYAALCLTSTHQGEGPVPTWETDAAEIRAYLGFAILMGFNKVPDLYDYWSTNPIFHYFPVASRISRKRFLEIQRFLHFTDNETIIPRGDPGYDRLAKVRPVIEALQKSFLESYRPHRENSIDEAMVKFKGRSALKQYVPKKPTKRGFKVWVRADAINGYVCDFQVYTGKNDSGETSETNLGAKVVKALSQPLVGGHYHLYYDNFFSSVQLFDDLLEDGLYACGTFRRDRKGIPDVIKTTQLRK